MPLNQAITRSGLPAYWQSLPVQQVLLRGRSGSAPIDR